MGDQLILSSFFFFPHLIKCVSSTKKICNEDSSTLIIWKFIIYIPKSSFEID